jgi:hypothetical protein
MGLSRNRALGSGVHWAFKPAQVVDIRRYPLEEQAAIREEIAQLSGKEDEKSKAA